MILVFIKSTDSFTINNQAFEWLLSALVYTIDRLVPHPEAFRAGVDGWSNSESRCLLLLKKNSIKQKALPGSILASYSDHSHVVIL